MSEFGPESYAPGEGASAAPEQLSEEARQRFAAAGAAMAQARREEKKSKKRDTRVARAIIQFLGDERHTHLFILISRLVARDCPSVFILAILSLIHEESKDVVEEYLAEFKKDVSSEAIDESMQLLPNAHMDEKGNRLLIQWITRMQLVLSSEANTILGRIMLDEHHMDGTVLQLTTFVMQDFFASEDGGRKNIPFENLHAFTVNILQSIFEPFLENMDKQLLQSTKESMFDDDDEE
jgi:hypothetical protein